MKWMLRPISCLSNHFQYLHKQLIEFREYFVFLFMRDKKVEWFGDERIKEVDSIELWYSREDYWYLLLWVLFSHSLFHVFCKIVGWNFRFVLLFLLLISFFQLESELLLSHLLFALFPNTTFLMFYDLIDYVGLKFFHWAEKLQALKINWWYDACTSVSETEVYRHDSSWKA